MEIRKYKPGEEEILMDIYSSSIRENAKAYYSEDQLKSWAPTDVDVQKWKERIKGINPYVILDSGIILGYADLQESGYIDHFFVKGGQSGKGIGKALMTHLISQAVSVGISEMTSDVSLAAQGFFGKFGFEIIQRKKVTIRGVELENAFMKKIINKSV